MKSMLLPVLSVLLLTGCAALSSGTSAAVPEPPEGTLVIYVRAGCPYCRQALDLLHREGVAPVVREVSGDRAAYEDLLAIYRAEFPEQKVIVPLLVCEGRYLRGFHRQAVLDFLAAAPEAVREKIDYCESSPGEAEPFPVPSQAPPAPSRIPSRLP